MNHKKMYIILIILGIIGIVIAFISLPRFGRIPQGERLKRIEQSPNYRNDAFQNLSVTPQLTSKKSRTEVMIDFLFGKKERNRPEENVPAIKTNLKNLPADKDLIVWFGHSSYFLQIEGKRFLIDPVFYDAAPLGFINSPFKGTDIYDADDMPNIDYLIITHDHWDHLDHTAVTRLRDRIGKVICPLGVGEHFEYWGYSVNTLIELDWNEQSQLSNNINIYCMPARHFSGRGLHANKTLWASFILKTTTKTIYISGDGGYDNHFAKIAKQFQPIDLAIMENGQYNNDWKYIHLLPDDLVKAINDLKPRAVIAGHNSKYALARHAWDEPMVKIKETATRDSIPLATPIIGEITYIK